MLELTPEIVSFKYNNLWTMIDSCCALMLDAIGQLMILMRLVSLLCIRVMEGNALCSHAPPQRARPTRTE